jgi:hypothetical protein
VKPSTRTLERRSEGDAALDLVRAGARELSVSLTQHFKELLRHAVAD